MNRWPERQRISGEPSLPKFEPVTLGRFDDHLLLQRAQRRRNLRAAWAIFDANQRL
jgi:hypothetical protein